MNTAVWLSFKCESCQERRDDRELNPVSNGNGVCNDCVPAYKKCGGCGLYMKRKDNGFAVFCTDCKGG